MPGGNPTDILAVISRLSFQFARTLQHNLSRGGPHEYTVRKNAQNDGDYVALFEAIQEHGVIKRWKDRPGRYLYPGDGWRYWPMTAKLNPQLIYSRHINRNRVEEADKLRALGLITDYTRKAE